MQLFDLHLGQQLNSLPKTLKLLYLSALRESFDRAEWKVPHRERGQGNVHWVFVSISLSQLILRIGGLNARYWPLEILLFEFPVFSCLPCKPSINEADRREGCFSSIKREFSTLSNDQTPDRSPVSLVGNQRVERSWISPGFFSNKALFPKKFALSLKIRHFHSLKNPLAWNYVRMLATLL